MHTPPAASVHPPLSWGRGGHRPPADGAEGAASRGHSGTLAALRIRNASRSRVTTHERNASVLTHASRPPRLQPRTRFALPAASRSRAGSRETEAEGRRERFREVTVAASPCGSRTLTGSSWTATCCGSRWAATARRCCRCCGASSRTTRTSGTCWARRPSQPAARRRLRERAGTGTGAGRRCAGPAGEREAGERGRLPLAPSEPLAKLSELPRPHFQVAAVGDGA